MENFKASMKEKMKSWGMWLAIAAFVVFLVKQFAGIDISEDVNNLLDVTLPLLIGFGIVNNPNDPEMV